ncbi:hypothetical protein [Streptomyces sp. NPDC057702]|uniref:hypothetical protein n=1 Tax=unclassified Streptomyces TaxID=2593676 RepID=UPI0036B7B807
MSTEDTPEDLSEETPGHTGTKTARKRRSPLAIATVAAAVMVVGGGGAYWASSASDDGGSHDGGRSSDTGDPAPLAIGERAGDTDEGIAPGEPDPTRARYQAPGDLPSAPRETAPVYRTAPKVSRAEVERLARALHVTGQPRLERGVWKVGGSPERMTPTLRVKETGAGGWSFTRFGAPGGDGCLEPPHTMGEDDATSSPASPRCGSLRDGTHGNGTRDAGRSRDAKGPKDAPAIPDGGSAPVSVAEAEKAARPVLEAVGQQDAKLDASRTYGAVRSVTANPALDGLPSYGWQTTLEVGVNGELDGASGFLTKLTKGDEYPLIDADQALKALNGEGQPELHCQPDTPSAPDVDEKGKAGPRGGDAGKREIAPCAPSSGKTVAHEVRQATFGLGMRFEEGRQVLVPSWIFTVRPADAKDGEADFTVTHPAVDPKYVTGAKSGPGAPADEDSDSGSGEGTRPGKQVESYRAEGTELIVRFWGGVCSTHTANADVSSSTVTVRVTSKEKKPGTKCVLVAEEFERKITLDKPVGDRTVVDATTGKSVPEDAKAGR